MSYSNKRQELLIVLSIIIMAVFFRFYQLDSVPPGLWSDEGANGVDALKAIDSGDYKLFYSNNNGREGLFINLQALSIKLLGSTPYALRVVSAIMGVLTVVGLYMLTRYLFDWRTASIASFLLAVSSWHVIFSRIGFRAIMLPLVLVWVFYFLWRGLRTGSLYQYIITGIIGGLGFYTYFSYRTVPLIALIVFGNYWISLKKDFNDSAYDHSRNQLLKGFTIMLVVVIIIALPLGIYFLQHPEDFLKRDGNPISVFAQNEPLKEFGLSIVKTLGMFNFSGDFNQRHKIPGWPELSIPISLLFAVGFIKELTHWLRRKHGHFSTQHTFLFSWFFIMLLPGFLSTEAPHALRTIGVLPVVMIFSAKGFWLLLNLLKRYHQITDYHSSTDLSSYYREKNILISVTIIIFLFSLGLLEYSRYFNVWAKEPALKSAFAQSYMDISDYLNNASPTITKYVLVNEGDVLVDDVPNNAQSIKFLTETYDIQSSTNKNIHYIRSDQVESLLNSKNNFILIPLAHSTELSIKLSETYGLKQKTQGTLTIYFK